MFGNPETTTGGNALKFYASVRLDIRRSTQIKDGKGIIKRTGSYIINIFISIRLSKGQKTTF